MPTGDADRIRAYATELVNEARRVGRTNMAIRAGDINRYLNLKNGHANVCQVLQGERFHKQAKVKFLPDKTEGTPGRKGANVTFYYDILEWVTGEPDLNDHQNPQPDPVPSSPPTSTAQPESLDYSNDINKVLRERIMNLRPNEFESLVGELLKARGFSDVAITGRSHDGGIDGHCEMPFVKVKVIFQAKRYATENSVGIEPVQRLVGSMSSGFDRGIFVTTSSFTTGAKGWVEEIKSPITLIDGDELVRHMVDLGLGIRTVPVVKHEINEEFFAGLEK